MVLRRVVNDKEEKALEAFFVRTKPASCQCNGIVCVVNGDSTKRLMR